MVERRFILEVNCRMTYVLVFAAGRLTLLYDTILYVDRVQLGGNIIFDIPGYQV